MQETQRLDTEEEGTTEAASSPPPEHCQPTSSNDEAPPSQRKQQGGTIPSNSGELLLDTRDLAWLQLLSWLLLQETNAPQGDWVVESTPLTHDDVAGVPDAAHDGNTADHRPLTSVLSSSRHTHVPRQLSLTLGLVGVGLLLLLSLSVAPSLLAPMATVTIIPTTKTLTTATIVTVMTGGTPDPARHEIPGRLLSSLTLSQARTVPTTGRGHQDARAARGTITLYNALPTAQTIPAGTLLIGADGVQVLTDQDAVIPAGTLSTNGQVSVPAHALEPGPGGNIRADGIYGACCRADVFAQNVAAFSGGQNARSFPMVTQQDIHGAVSVLTAALAQSAQAAFQAQVHPKETLIAPVPCTSSSTSNHAAGEEAIQVRVTVAETCTGVAYSTQALQALVTEMVTEEATGHLGAGYRLTGVVQVTITPSTVNDYQRGTVTLRVKGAGIWIYRFPQEQLQRFGTLIAGTSKTQATQLLLQQPGVRAIAISIAGGDSTTLPGDPKRIRVVVLYQAG